MSERGTIISRTIIITKSLEKNILMIENRCIAGKALLIQGFTGIILHLAGKRAYANTTFFDVSRRMDGMVLRGYEISQQTFAKELIRKAIHSAIAFVPTLARWNFHLTVVALSLGIILYSVNESARVSGRSNGIISLITEIASRPTEHGFIWGPVTLGLGTLAALLYYPNPSATIGIYALAFGDGIASLARPLRNHANTGKEEGVLLGSLFCFMAVFLSACIVLNDLRLSLISATVATGLELILMQDVDNLIIPLGTALAISLAM